MASPPCVNCEAMRELFEGREAIYIEKGALRVRVSDIRADIEARHIQAQVEEIPTAGLEDTIFHRYHRGLAAPLRWQIDAGYLTLFSETAWSMGYGGWSLYFAPNVVSGVTALAATWPAALDSEKRYEQTLRFVLAGRHKQFARVFPG